MVQRFHFVWIIQKKEYKNCDFRNNNVNFTLVRMFQAMRLAALPVWHIRWTTERFEREAKCRLLYSTLSVRHSEMPSQTHLNHTSNTHARVAFTLRCFNVLFSFWTSFWLSSCRFEFFSVDCGWHLLLFFAKNNYIVRFIKVL